MNNINTVLHYYYFNIEKDKEKKEYEYLKKRLKDIGLICFDSLAICDKADWYKGTIKPLDDKPIELETKFLFNNQWNTAPTITSKLGLRLMDWAEAIYPNRNIKEGYWLEQNPPMKEIRENTYKCGYCGKQYFKPKIKKCTACSKGEFAPEGEQIKLTVLKPVSERG